MGIKFIKVKKKPVEVEAFQLIEHMILFGKNPRLMKVINNRKIFVDGESFRVETLEGDMKAKVGDWIIKGIEGEIYPCRNDIFKKTYDIINKTFVKNLGEVIADSYKGK